MDNRKDIKSLNNLVKRYDSTVSFNMFESDSSFSVIYKKTERIVTAMYLITNLIDDSEPIKWRMRVKGNTLLSLIISLKNLGVRKGNDDGEKIQNTIAEIISLFEIAHFSGMVSEMNFNVIKNEFIKLIDLITAYKDGSFKSHVIFDSAFFETPENKKETTIQTVDNNKGQTFVSKGQAQPQQRNDAVSKNVLDDSTVQNKNIGQTIEIVKTDTPDVAHVMSEKTTTALLGIYDVKKSSDLKKTNRRSLIVNTIRKKGPVTIKDIAGVIKGCSDKTIQRELSALVEMGALKREGERRWSTYSIAE